MLYFSGQGGVTLQVVTRHFTTSETIHTENSYKFTYGTIRKLLDEAGFEVQHTWTDARGWYSVTFARIH